MDFVGGHVVALRVELAPGSNFSEVNADVSEQDVDRSRFVVAGGPVVFGEEACALQRPHGRRAARRRHRLRQPDCHVKEPVLGAHSQRLRLFDQRHLRSNPPPHLSVDRFSFVNLVRFTLTIQEWIVIDYYLYIISFKGLVNESKLSQGSKVVL